MNCIILSRNFYAVANLRFFKMLILQKPVTSLPVAYSTVKKDNKSSSSNNDSIDIFLDELITNKLEKWKCKSSNKRLSGIPGTSNHILEKSVSVKKADIIEIMSKDALASSVCDKKDLFNAAEKGNHDFVANALLYSSIQPNIICYEDLKILATNFLKSDSLQGIAIIEEIARKKLKICGGPLFYEQQIKCLKQRGENTKALNFCDIIYKNHPETRREVRGYLSHILIDIVENHSEAALMQGKELVERLSIDYKDFRPISSLWHACFLSEWFSDQQVASQLLIHVIKHKSIVTIERRLLAATYTALAQHRPQLIHSLLQDLISCNMPKHISPVLRALFDYKCKSYVSVYNILQKPSYIC